MVQIAMPGEDEAATQIILPGINHMEAKKRIQEPCWSAGERSPSVKGMEDIKNDQSWDHKKREKPENDDWTFCELESRYGHAVLFHKKEKNIEYFASFT